jgi:hypothetical protein
MSGSPHGYPDWADTQPAGKSRRGPVIALCAVVVVLAAGLLIWWFSGGQPGNAQGVAAPAPATTTVPATASGDSGVAYDVGTCFDETSGGAPGNVRLDPVPCAGNRAVFVINQVVSVASACDIAGVDYRQHGYEVPDETARVTYCASLVVPPNQCFVISGAEPIARAACGSAGDVVKVLTVATANSVSAACAGQADPDVWYFQSPDSGQYACVSRPAEPSTPTTVPTSG